MGLKDVGFFEPRGNEVVEWDLQLGRGEEQGSSLRLNVDGSGSRSPERTGWNKQIVREDHVSKLELTQHVGEGIQETNSLQGTLGLVFIEIEWPGLVPDLFNLMPIIEHNQRARKKKQYRRKRQGGFPLGNVQLGILTQKIFSLPELGKRHVRDELGVEARHREYRRLLETKEVISSSAEVNVVQLRRHQ